MGAGGFGTLAGHFTDRTVITYDPRGVERSVKADPTTESTPEQHADDLHRVIAEIGLGPVDLFASSGGAVNALALVAAHPEDVRTLVAHEPPLASILPDRDGAMAFTQAIHDTYERSGFGPAMAQFILAVSHQGPMTAEFASAPAPDPAMFGLPTEDDGTRTDALLGQNIVTCTHYEPDFDALRAASTRIVVGVGVESDGPAGGPGRGRRGRASRDDAGAYSPVATAASWATNTASPATRSASRRRCGRCSRSAVSGDPRIGVQVQSRGTGGGVSAQAYSGGRP